MKLSCLVRGLVFATLALVGIEQAAAQLTIESRARPYVLGIRGEAGTRYLLEQTADLRSTNAWSPLLNLRLPSDYQTWSDPSSLTSSARFYRLKQVGPSRLVADNFRLLDQNGKASELSYYWTDRAVVLVFADSSCSDFPALAAKVKSLSARFTSQRVRVWIVASQANNDRALLASQAAAAGLELPVLQDRGQVLARDFGVATLPEAVCISPVDWTVFYRGAIDDLTSALASQNYVADALTAFLAGSPITFTKTPPIAVCATDIAARQTVSYSTEIAPMLQKNCVVCHSPGNIGSWNMTNYFQVQSYSRLIKSNVLSGLMPPWHADPAYGVFTNDVSLKPTEIASLVQWINDGSPRGSGPDPLAAAFAVTPPTTNYPVGWPTELGSPDFIVSIPKQTLPATGEVDYRYLTVTAAISSNVWLRAAVILPGNRRVVHHALAFQGTVLDLLLSGGGLNGYFAAYVPGMEPVTFPSGTGKPLSKNAVMTFQMHYTTTGQAETDQTQLGLYFSQVPPMSELLTRAAFTTSISIPPGAQEYAREAQMTPSTTRDVWLYEMSPHMHLRGSSFQFEALYPNGTSEVLLSVPKYDFRWQTLYRLAQPKRLPARTIIRCRGTFDNSAQNLANPNPSLTVSFGEQTDDEMFIGYVNFSVIP